MACIWFLFFVLHEVLEILFFVLHEVLEIALFD